MFSLLPHFTFKKINKHKMKKTILKLALTGMIAGTVLIAGQLFAEKPSSVKNNAPVGIESLVAQTDIQQLRHDSTSEWQKFKKNSEKQIAKNDKRISELNESIAKESNDKKADLQASVNDLKKKNDDLKSQLAAYKESTKENFDVFKEKFDNGLNSVTKSIKDIKIG
jgi:uncharacterized protein YPO0396